MPFYRFHLNSNVPPRVAIERIHGAIRDKPTPREQFQAVWSGKPPDGPPFTGFVQDNSFRIQNVIYYRNSFLPLVRGRIVPTSTGSRVYVAMFMHPLASVFMLCWLGMMGYGALTDKFSSPMILWEMFTFVLVTSVASFLYEAAKAKRLLSTILLDLHY
jgi:hypothetical protein